MKSLRHGLTFLAMLGVLFAGSIVNVVALPEVAAAQSGCPSIFNGAVLTATQWNACFAAKRDLSTPVITGPLSVGTGDLACWQSVNVITDCGAPLTVAAGAGITVSKTGNSYGVANAGVLSLNGGATGLTPNTATTGAVTLSGTLAIAHGGTGTTSSTGTGSLVLASSPTLVTPALGVPSSVTLTNATGLPLTTGVTGILPVANGGTGVTSSSGTGAVVLGTSPTITTPAISGGTLNSASIGQTTPAAGTFTTLAGSSTATNGAYSRTLADHFADAVNLKDFAALDGTTDDASAINAVLAARKCVLLPFGVTALIGSTLSVPSGGCIIAQGLGATIKAKAGFNGDLIRNATTNPASLAARDAGLTFQNLALDGNKANVTSSYCVELDAVDGAAFVNVKCINPTGDGLYLGAATGSATICGAGITGDFRVENAGRNGVSGICFEDVNLRVYGVAAALWCVDIEANSTSNYQRNSFFDIIGESCGASATGTGGGLNLTPAEPGSGYVENITARFVINGGDGHISGGGVVWRSAKNLRLSGQVVGFTGNAFLGNSGATNPSTVTLDVDSVSATSAGFASAEVVGSKYYGRIRVVSAGNKAFDLSHLRGGELTVSSTGAAQQGLVLGDVQDVIWHADIQGSNSHNVWVSSLGGVGSTGNRFPNLRATGAGSFGQGFIEDGGSNNNVVTNGRISGNGAGQVSLVGATSRVELEPLKATATWDPPSIATGACATTTVTVTGAATGDQVRAGFSLSLAGLTLSAYASTTNTDTAVLCNFTGSAVDLASGTLQVLNQKVY